jgi:hypothetical protein
MIASLSAAASAVPWGTVAHVVGVVLIAVLTALVG